MDTSYEDDFCKYNADFLDSTYDCVDRLVINAYCSLCQQPAGFRFWWRNLHDGSDKDLDKTHLMRMADRFGRRSRGWAKAHDIPVLFCEAGDRKHDIAEPYVPKDANFVGVFLIQVSRAPAPIWEVRRFGQNGLDLKRKTPWAHVNHYFFHIIDPEWGHITIRMSSHPPFGALIIVNGHEWVERQARKQKLQTVKEGNCFTLCSDGAALDQIAESLNTEGVIGRLSEVCDRWIYSACLIFGLDLEEQKRSAFHYNYSVYQIEQSRNLIFKSGHELDEIYQASIDRTRPRFDIRTLKTIFAWSHRPHRNGRNKDNKPKVTIEKPSYDLTVLKLQFGHLSLKIYDKGERLLRIEATVLNARELRCGTVLSKLPDIIASLKAMVVRFLNVLRAAHTCCIDQQQFDQLPMPTVRGGKRLAGIDINQPRTRHVLHALTTLAPKAGGFTITEVAQKVRQLTGLSEQQYGNRQAAYDLAKLRGKTLVEKKPRARRYHISVSAFQCIAALFIIREKVIKPVLAGAGRIKPGPPPKFTEQVDLHYHRLQAEMRATFQTLGIGLV